MSTVVERQLIGGTIYRLYQKVMICTNIVGSCVAHIQFFSKAVDVLGIPIYSMIFS